MRPQGIAINKYVGFTKYLRAGRNLQEIDLRDSSEDNKLTDHQRQVVNTAEDAHNMGWRVLSLYAALTAHNQMVWICFSPIKDKAGIFFDLGPSTS